LLGALAGALVTRWWQSNPRDSGPSPRSERRHARRSGGAKMN
jgi:hypothetical protein